MKKINTIIVLAILNVLISSSYLYSKNSNELYEKIDLFSEVLETIKKEYVDEVDQAEVMDSAINGVLQSLSEHLVSELKKIGINNCRIEGRESSDWKLVDAIDIIIHLFHPEKREFYDLEKMWSEPTPKEKALI